MTNTTADATQRLLADERGTCFLVPGVLSPGECQEWIATTERLGYAPTGGAYPPASISSSSVKALIRSRAASSVVHRRWAS